MAAISRRWLGGRIYNNTRTRERLRRKCVKPADLTTHSPPKALRSPPHSDTPFPNTSAPPRSADARPPRDDARPPTSQHIPHRRPVPAPAQRRALPEHFRSPTQRDAFLADPTTHSPPKTCSRPRTATRTARTLPLPHAAPMHARRLRDAFFTDLTTHSPPKAVTRPRTATRPTRALSHSLPAPTHLTQRRRTPAGCAMHFPPTSQPIPRRRPSPAPHSDTPLPFCSASGTKKRHRTVDVRCRMSRSTVVAVGHWGW